MNYSAGNGTAKTELVVSTIFTVQSLQTCVDLSRSERCSQSNHEANINHNTQKAHNCIWLGLTENCVIKGFRLLQWKWAYFTITLQSIIFQRCLNNAISPATNRNPSITGKSCTSIIAIRLTLLKSCIIFLHLSPNEQKISILWRRTSAATTKKFYKVCLFDL